MLANTERSAMPTITIRVQRLLKQTDRMRQQAVKSLLRTLKHIDQERKQRTADLEDAAKVILKQLTELGHGGSNGRALGKKAKRVAAAGKRRRIRRTPDQLKAEATKVLAMIRKADKDGIGGAEIRKSVNGVGQNIKAFVEKNAGVKIRTTGQKVKMRYHAA
jgi:hypothetical protein